MDAQKLHEKITDYANAKKAANIALGKYLAEMKDTGGYEQEAGEGSRWTDYLSSPEVKMSHTTATRYIGIYRKYIMELGLDYSEISEYDTYSLYQVMKKVDKDNWNEWKYKLKNLSRSDIDREVRYGEENVMTCSHKFQPFKEKCHKCGEIQSVKTK